MIMRTLYLLQEEVECRPQKKTVDIEINFGEQSRRGGNRGRGGRWRGGRGGPRGEQGSQRRQAQVPQIDNELDFPSLGK